MNGGFPRRLRAKEWELLCSILPADRKGYRDYRELISSMMVIAEGTRGPGNLILGYGRDVEDPSPSRAPVIAYGMIETTRDTFSIAVRECTSRQIDVEIVSTRGEEIPDHFEEKRRWTYSTWTPGQPSPATGAPVREVTAPGGLVLVFAPEERRLWIHDAGTGMNLPLPITNYHSELMQHKRIRDPEIALSSARFFGDLATYSDDDLWAAFVAYNARRRRVEIPPPGPSGRGLLRGLVRKIFRA